MLAQFGSFDQFLIQLLEMLMFLFFIALLQYSAARKNISLNQKGI